MNGASTSDWGHEVAALFAAALETPPPDREKFLERECAGRPDLKREVEALLHASDSAEDRVARSEAVIRGGHPCAGKPGDAGQRP